MPRGKVKQRVVQIFRLEDDKLLAVRAASSPKQGLLAYYEENLKSRGCRNPKVNGNVLTVTYKRKPARYRAVDV